jgi:hypothetical protein
VAELMQVFAEEMVFLPSSTDPTRQGVNPVMSGIEGKQFIVVGTSPESLRDLGNIARFVVTLTGRQVLSGVAESVGVVVKMPQGSFVVDADLIAEAAQAFGIHRRTP